MLSLCARLSFTLLLRFGHRPLRPLPPQLIVMRVISPQRPYKSTPSIARTEHGRSLSALTNGSIRASLHIRCGLARVLRSTAFVWPPITELPVPLLLCNVIPLAHTATIRTNPAYTSYVSPISHDDRTLRDPPSASVIGKREACIEPTASYSVAAFVMHENRLDLRYCGA